MGRYTIIAEIDEHLRQVLADGLVPELLPDKNAVGLCSPDEKGDLNVGICLYDICENENLRISGMVNHSMEKQMFPPTYLSLYYMITVWSASDIRYRAIQEHRILGRIIQLLKDQNLWASENFDSEGKPDIRVEFLDLTTEEKIKIWNQPSVPYRTSLFFRVAPVSLDSSKSREIRRVMSVEMQVKEQGGSHGREPHDLESPGNH